MKTESIAFDAHHCIEHLRHYLPAQAALRDFVHHNTLHAFMDEKFHEALQQAGSTFGYSTYLPLNKFRAMLASGKIREDVLDKVIGEHCAQHAQQGNETYLKDRMLHGNYTKEHEGRIGVLRNKWKACCGVNLDKAVHPMLFRTLSAFLDQGIALQSFPHNDLPFLEALRLLDKSLFTGLFKGQRARRLLHEEATTIDDLLRLIVGDEALFETYLFDQQFAHPGWSGFVSVVETQPQTLLDVRHISLEAMLFFELLLEIDALDQKFGGRWLPLSKYVLETPPPLFAKARQTELAIVQKLWQEAFEWSYFDDVITAMKAAPPASPKKQAGFQALFCIDDRAYSLRRHIGKVDERAETFGTPGYFGIEFYFRPEFGKFLTKACPANLDPTFIIPERNRQHTHHSDLHFERHSHSMLSGWLISGTLGFWSALKMFAGIFRPRGSAAAADAFAHMDSHSELQIDATGETEEGRAIGFTYEQMAERVGRVLHSIGLVADFAPLVYVVGHGGSSVNNPYYAGYDCGACAGRPGGVNARVFAYMANKAEVRALLAAGGLFIPDGTSFVGALHDTTRDEIQFYDVHALPEDLAALHRQHRGVFEKALEENARERSFRFDTMRSDRPAADVHKQIRKRSVSLFEPRPEWNHAANALCIVGRRSMFEHIYLDKRPFLNSYDHRHDPEGLYLHSILAAAIPVCGGINLEYYFSRVDQLKLGSGTKLPHNVVGLFAVANGIDGDLRPGLPSQMVEIHDAVRLLFIIEQRPDLVARVLHADEKLLSWVRNEWVLMCVKDPESGTFYRYLNGSFAPYAPLERPLRHAMGEADIIAATKDRHPIIFTA